MPRASHFLIEKKENGWYIPPMQTHTQLLTQAGILAKEISRQVWLMTNGQITFCSLEATPGYTIIARVFGPGDYILEE